MTFSYVECMIEILAAMFNVPAPHGIWFSVPG